MQRDKIFPFILCSITFLLCLTSCNKNSGRLIGKSDKCSVISSTEQKDILSPSTENLAIDVFLDATLSMKGFTEADSFSYYQQTIPLIESSAINSLRGEKVFYKFGNKSQALSNREFLQAQKPEFYTDKNFNTQTLIENVLENANPNNLTIVVTDLFQNNADVNQLSEKIKSKYINSNLAVGIMGIKSQFSGSVYDVGSNNYSFPYKTIDESNLRPFYILAFGSHSNIDKYFNALEQDGIKDFPLKQRIILSPYLTQQPASYLNADVQDKKNINELSGTIVNNEQNLNNFGEFSIRNETEPAEIDLLLPFQKLPGIVNFSNELEQEINSFACSATETADANTQNKNSFVPQSSASGAVNIEEKNITPEGIRLKIKFAPEKLESGTVNAFRIILRPKQISLFDWVDEWNMTDSDIRSWIKNPKQFDGTKTYNLKHFLQTLWTTNQNVHRPKAADFYLYIKP